MRIRRLADQDWDVSLECVCADDFGAGYQDDSELTDEQRERFGAYESTREAHQRLAILADERGIRHYVADTDDKDSKHSDAYLYFRWSQLTDVMEVLAEANASGDILDVPEDFPVQFEEYVKDELGWSVERTL